MRAFENSTRSSAVAAIGITLSYLKDNFPRFFCTVYPIS